MSDGILKKFAGTFHLVVAVFRNPAYGFRICPVSSDHSLPRPARIRSDRKKLKKI